MANLSRQGNSLLSSFLELVGYSDQGLAGSEFAGTWAVRDSHGDPFEITLFGTGTAEADRAGEGMSGTWTLEGPTAVIAWDTGWTTKITRTSDGYSKTAYDPTSATPTNTSAAEKLD